MTKEIRFSGLGGQGIILIGSFWPRRRGFMTAKRSSMPNPMAGSRGGAVRSEVVIGEADEEIDYPAVINPDILVAMSQEAADRYAGR